jgi:hypothetical protein
MGFLSGSKVGEASTTRFAGRCTRDRRPVDRPGFERPRSVSELGRINELQYKMRVKRPGIRLGDYSNPLVTFAQISLQHGLQLR